MPGETKGTPQPISLGDEGGQRKDFRQDCKYGKDCYQKNPMHHQKFKHPSKGGATPAAPEPEQEEKKVVETLVEEPPAKRMKAATLSPKKESPKKHDDTKAKKGEEVTDGTASSKSKCLTDEEQLLKVPDDENSELVPPFDEWPKDAIKSVEQRFLTKMPDDFMAFWEFCKSINMDHPEEALLKTCNLRLVGPYDILAKTRFETRKLNDFLCHYRYYRDPPEFQTVIVSTKEDSTFHIGYFRDDPKEVPVFVTSMGGEKAEADNNKFVLMGDNLFSALYHHVTKLVNNADPFNMRPLQKLKESIHVHANMKNQVQKL